MNRRRLVPPTHLLLAFTSVARHLNVSRAAGELNLTQSAVSRQIQQLERLLDMRMFERVRKRLVLTEAGRTYADALAPALDAIANATLRSAIRSDGSILNLASLPTFGSRWLVPRMSGFQRAHPDFTVHFNTRLETFDFEAEPIDAAIHFGSRDWPGATLDHLMDEILVAVCSPTYAAQRNLRGEADLSRCLLLQIISERDSWSDWFDEAGFPRKEAATGSRFQLYSMLIQAAASSMGVALVPEFLIQEELESGRLVAAVDRRLKNGGSYYLAYPERARSLPAFQAFRRWLLDEVAPLAAPLLQRDIKLASRSRTR